MNWRTTACVVIALITFFAFVYTPISDSDFWWHIAAGQWIVAHGALPATDPFGVFSAADPVRNSTVLRGQWLGQVMLFELFDLWGSAGVIAMRALLLTACLSLLFWRARLLGAAMWTNWAILIPSGFLALGFTNDRPQLFSYLLAALLFMAIENYQRTRVRGWLWTLPLIAVVWANIHAAFLLAVALLPLYVAALWLQARRQQDFRVRHGGLAFATFAFVTATLLNPNGLTSYAYLFNLEGSALQTATSEYISSFALYTLGNVVPQIWVALHSGVNRSLFPVAALDALGDKNIAGKIFNHMQWGGYLLWRLSPAAHLYVDGRMLDSARLEPYRHILWATPSGVELLRREQFDTVMLPPSNRFTGERYALVDYLRIQPEWHMQYQDRDAVVFVRR